MSQRNNSTRSEPARTRKSSRKDKEKSGSGDIGQMFKMAGAKNDKVTNKETESKAEQSVSEVFLPQTNAHNNENAVELNEEPFPQVKEIQTKEIAIQVSPIDFELSNHDEATNVDPDANANKRSIGVSIDSCKEQILEAMSELTTKYNKLDDIINHPKNGIGAQIVKMMLKGDNLYTDIHGATEGILVKMSKLQENVEANKVSTEHLGQGQNRLTNMMAENKRLSQDLVITQGLLQKYSQKIEVLEKKVLDLTRRGMEQNLTFHAVEEAPEGKREDCYATVVDYVRRFLEVEIDENDVWKAHRLGVYKTNKSRPIFAKLSYYARDRIMESVGALKDKRNVHGQVRFISEHIPDGIVETKKTTLKRASAAKVTEAAKPAGQQRQVKIIADKVIVGGEISHPEITTPQPFELFPGVEEQKQIDAVNRKIVEAQPTYSKNSTFVGLAVTVKSVDQVKSAYKAVMQRFPYMDHVMMAYQFKNSEEERVRFGSCDDNEYGAGRVLAAHLHTKKVKNIAVFVVRQYGGLNLGQDRFRLIEQAAQEAIDKLRPPPEPPATD